MRSRLLEVISHIPTLSNSLCQHSPQSSSDSLSSCSDTPSFSSDTLLRLPPILSIIVFLRLSRVFAREEFVSEYSVPGIITQYRGLLLNTRDYLDFCFRLGYASVNSKHQHPPPPGQPPGFCTLLLPRGRHLYLMTLPRGRVFAYP